MRNIARFFIYTAVVAIGAAIFVFLDMIQNITERMEINDR